MPKLDILGGSSRGRSLNINASRSVNLYAEIDSDPESRAVLALIGDMGANLWQTVGSSAVRGTYSFAGYLFVVSGNHLYSISSAGVVSASLGTLATSVGRVSMCDNGLLSLGIGGNQLIILDGYNYYIYNVATPSFTQYATGAGCVALPVTVLSGHSILSYTVTSRGTGYSAGGNTVTITDSQGLGATATPVIGFPILSVTIINGGSVSGIPSVTITDTYGAGVSAGISWTSPSGPVLTVLIGAGGHGYVNPTLTFNNCTGVVATVQLDNGGTKGEVVAITPTVAGSGYLAPAVSVSGNATATATLANDLNYSITNFTIINGGTGYVSAPAVTVTGPGGTTAATAHLTANSVSSITFTGGIGYTAIPSVSVAPPPGVVTFANPTQVAFIDGYFVMINQTMTTICTNIYDGTTISALATSPVQSAPDNIMAVVTVNQNLLYIKQYNSEIWYDAGTPTSQGFPFQRMQGGVLDYGTNAPWSVCKGAGSVFWLGTQRINDGGNFVGVVMLNNFNPVIVSTPAVTYQMSLWTDWANAFSFCYSDGGHTFIQFTSPADNQTFVFDATIFPFRPDCAWHERSTYANSPYQFNRHFANTYTYFNSMHLAGDYQSGGIYQMSPTFLTDIGGAQIAVVRRTDHLFDKDSLEKLYINKLQLDIETGTAPAGVNPTVSFSWSTDNGNTFSTPYVKSLGTTGQYSTRALFWRLGYGYDRSWQIMCQDNCRKILLGGYAEGGE